MILDVAKLLTRSVGHPSHKPVVRYKSFLYQAACWKTARRMVAKVEVHFGLIKMDVDRNLGCQNGNSGLDVQNIPDGTWKPVTGA